MDPRDLLLAAVHAVAPGAMGTVPAGADPPAGRRMAAAGADAVIEVIASADAEVARVLDRLSPRERDDVALVLDGMLRDPAAHAH